jgi:hypothetical protein
MEKLKRLINHLVIIPVLLITGCGYISDKPVENIDVYRTDELQSCQIDVSKLSEIFTSDEKAQIDCLQQNFVQFTKYVRSKNPGSVSEDEMGIFVKKFFQGQSQAIINGLSLIFQLNMILLKDESDRISHSNITPLFKLLVQVNQNAVVMTNVMKLMDDPKNQKDFWSLREKFSKAITDFATSAVGVIENSPGYGQKLNMRKFIIDMSSKIGDTQIDNDTIDCFIFLKKVFVGGDPEIITTDEVKEVIKKLPGTLGLIFDVYYSKGENFKSQSGEMVFYLAAVRNFYHLIKFDQPDFELLDSDNLVTLAKKFLKNYDVDAFKPSLEALKARFIGGKKDSITLKDLDTVINIVHDFVEKVYFNFLTYEDPATGQLLSKATPITEKDLPFKKLPGYEVFKDKSRLDQLFTSFQDTAISFRYFRDTKVGAATYDTKVVRNKDGFNEVNISKWLSWKLLRAYGEVDKTGQMQMTMDQFSSFLLDAKPILEEFKLWSPNFQTFSRNSVLLGDLFQQQSNGDQKININEATEYIGMLLTAVDISGKFNDSLKSYCDPGINPSEAVFEATCFNKNFYDVFLNKLDYKKSLPRLAVYFNTADRAETMGYLSGVEGFARDDNSPGVPVNRRDSTLIFGAMMNIETTFIRFDKNNDNVIDYDELSEAYFTYRASIISLAGLKGDQIKYAKGIFLYMVSKMEVPDTGSWISSVTFAAFNSCVQSDFCRKHMLDPIEAKRLNIGKLLYYMVNQPTAEVEKNIGPRLPENE